MAMSWQYVAGFFDGEGNIRISGTRTSVQVSLHQSGQRGLLVLLTICDFLQHEGVKSKVAAREERTKNQRMYRLYIYNRINAMAFIRGCMPYLHVKKVESQDIFRLLTLYPGNRIAATFKSHCKNGHPLIGDNLYLRKRKGKLTRQCRECSMARANNRYSNKIGRTKIAPEVLRWL